jgi:uncharacterized protein
MIIDLKGIVHGPREFSFILEPSWWQFQDETPVMSGLDGPLEVRIRIRDVENKFLIEGQMSGGLRLICDRCIGMYRTPLRADFRVFVAVAPASDGGMEIELLEDDMDVHFTQGNEIDLADIVREQVYLSLPMKSLCRADCAGLCPVCGVDLNREPCRCPARSGHPAFLKLKDLKLGGNQN